MAISLLDIKKKKKKIEELADTSTTPTVTIENSNQTSKPQQTISLEDIRYGKASISPLNIEEENIIQKPDKISKKELRAQQEELKKKEIKELKQKYGEKKKQYQSELKDYNEKKSKEMEKVGISSEAFDNRSLLNKGNDKISFQTKNTDQKSTTKFKNYQPAMAKVYEELKEESNQITKTENELNLLNYYVRQAEVDAEDTTLYDKTIGTVTRGIKDLGSLFSIQQREYTDPQTGKKMYLPTRNELKQAKVSEDYKTGVGRFLGDASYNISKILGSTALNTVTAGVGGTSLYWTDMYTDSYQNAINEGYSGANAVAYSTVATGAEYITGKLLGSATKGLTGGKTSQLNSAISNATNRLINNPKISNLIGSAASEGTEEFVQEYIDNLNRLITLENSTNVKDYLDIFTDKDIFGDALYSAGVGALSGGVTTVVDSNGRTIQDNTSLMKEFKTQLENSKNNTTDKTKIEKYNRAITLVDNYLSNPFTNDGNVSEDLVNSYSELVPEIQNQIVVQQSNPQQSVEDVRNRTIRNQVNTFNLNQNVNTVGKAGFINSARKYNIKIDNDTVQSINRVMSERGINATFDDTQFKNTNVNALWRMNDDGIREVIFNPNANTKDLMENVAVHELYHDIANQQGNDYLQNLVLDMASTKNGYLKARESLANEYAKVYDINNPNFNNIVNEEAVASILGEKLGNQEFINQLTTEKRSVAKVIYDNVVSILNKINKLTGYKSEKIYWTDVKNKFEKAYKNISIKQNNTVLDNNTKYHISESLNEKIDNVLENINERNPVKLRDYTPDILVKNGIKNLPMYENPSHIRKNILTEEEAKNIGLSVSQRDHYHGLGKDVYIKAIDSLDNPRAIFKNNKNGDYLILTIIKDKNNNNIVVPIEIETTTKINRVKIDTNRIKSVYGYKKINNIDLNDYIKHNIKNNVFTKIYAQKKEQGTGFSTAASSFSRNNISDSNQNVKSDTKYSMKESGENTQRPDDRSYSFNQSAKRYNNLSSIDNKDIGHSKQNSVWQEYVKKNFKNEGTGRKLQDLKEKTTRVKKDNESKLTTEEQQELNALESVPFELSNEEAKRLNDLRDKANGNIRFSELINKTSYSAIKTEYNKYKNQMNSFNTKILNNAEKTISANKQGRRTKSEWLDVAEHIGLNINTDDAKQLEKYAIQSFLYAQPNQSRNLNRQGKKYVKFTIEEWLQRVYKGAGVGERYSLDGNTDTNTTVNLAYGTSNEDIMNRISRDNQSKFYENITERSKFLTEENRNKLAQEDDIKFYDKVTNKESMNSAMKKLKDGGQSEIDSWFMKERNYDSTDVAEGWILLKRAQDAGDYDMMAGVAKKMRQMGTKSGQAIQMYNLLGRLTPEGMVKYATNELDEAWHIASKNKSKKWIANNEENFQLSPEETKFIVDQMNKVSTMEDGYEKNVEIAKVQKMLEDKLPPEKGQGLKAWMRISMLFNPKTQVRNILGNAVITPVNVVSDTFASIVDKQISKKTGIRTTGGINKGYLKGFKEGLYKSYNDFKLGINTRDVQGNRFEVGQGKSFNERHTGALARQRDAVSKAFNRIDSLLSFVLDAGDRGFYEASFVNSINNQKVLNNTNEVTQDMLDIATNEALSRTWQDNNNYTRFVLEARSNLNKLFSIKGYGIGDVLIPFAKTPANLTKAIVDYSPIGLVKTLTVDAKKLNNNISTGTVTSTQQHQFVQNLGKATAGTMLYIAGMALAQAGITSGANDEDKDVSDFMKNTLGIQPYSIKIGNHSFTYDWAQPVAAPFAITANITKALNDEELTLEDAIMTSLDSGFNILMEQSFVSGLRDVFDTSHGSIIENLGDQVLGLPARAVPTFVKQINDLIDPNTRMVYESKDQTKSAENQVKTKIPGLSNDLPVKRDTLGREIKKYGGENNIFNVFFNPANTTKGKISESAKVIYDVYQKTKDKTIMPRYPASVLGLNNKQQSEFLKISGKIVDDNVKKLSKTTYYQKLDIEDKAVAIKGIVDYAYNYAKSEVLDTEMAKTYNAANKAIKRGVTLYDYYAKRTYENR